MRRGDAGRPYRNGGRSALGRQVDQISPTSHGVLPPFAGTVAPVAVPTLGQTASRQPSRRPAQMRTERPVSQTAPHAALQRRRQARPRVRRSEHTAISRHEGFAR
jgi:hypothetical protein